MTSLNPARAPCCSLPWICAEPDVPLLAEDGLNRLVALGLLEAEAEGALLLHRLVAAFVERTGPDPGARAAVESALLDEANRLNEAGYPAPLLAWQLKV